MENKCVCGLNHNHDLPEKYEYWPVVGAAYFEGEKFKSEYCCHVCGSAWITSKDEKEWHHKDCHFDNWRKENGKKNSN